MKVFNEADTHPRIVALNARWGIGEGEREHSPDEGPIKMKGSQEE